MFKQIQIENLRGINNLELNDLKQINLIVGKNNCNKSTILEGIFQLINPPNIELFLRINAFRSFVFFDETTWQYFFNKLDTSIPIKLVGYRNNNEKRELIIKPFKSTDITQNPKVVETDEKNGLPMHTGTKPKTIGLISNYTFNKTGNKELHFASKIYQSGLILKQDIPVDYIEELSGTLLSPTNFHADISKLYNDLQISKKKEKIIKIIQQIEPTITDIILGSEGILYCDVGLNHFMPINMMGDGLSRLFSIIVKISSFKNGIVLIDEVECGLHYSSLKILWDAIFLTAKEYNVQIFATTHSKECVDAFYTSYNSNKQLKDTDIIRLIRIEKIDGLIKSILYDSQELHSVLEKDWEVR